MAWVVPTRGRNVDERFSVSAYGNAKPDGAWLYVDEITHRTINDLTIMLSMVERASSIVSDPACIRALNGISMRLHAAATAYYALRPPRNSDVVNLDEQLETLCAALSYSILSERAIKLMLVSDPIPASAQVGWKICIIIAELIMNAARHAFRPHSGGSIVVEASAQARAIRCAVTDNGSAPDVIMPGRGSCILEAIAAEIGGTIFHNHTNRGSSVVLLVPNPESTAARPSQPTPLPDEI